MSDKSKLPRAADVVAGDKLCPRCLAVDHQKIELKAEHQSMALIIWYWKRYCPRCGWSDVDEEIKYFPWPLRLLFAPHVIIRRHNWVYQTTLFTVSLEVILTYIIWFLILPQLIQQLGVTK